MRPPAVFLLALAFAFLILTNNIVASEEIEANPSPTRGHFLKEKPAKKIPKGRAKKCNHNPAVCRYEGSTAPDCCGTTCVDTATDVFNCGKCGKVCKFTESCCGGKCVDLNFDKRHCGSCGIKCIKGVLCIYGMCNYA